MPGRRIFARRATLEIPSRYLRTALEEGAFPAIRAYAPWGRVYERIKAQRGANVAKGAVRT